jgi:aspartate aminotransferase
MSNLPSPSLNRAVQGLTPSATLAINELAKRLHIEGKVIYKLAFGQSPFPVPKHVVKQLKRHAHEKDYLPVSGLPELRTAVATYHGRVNELRYAADQILIGPGSKELLYILQVVFNGILYLPSPCWLSYAPQGRLTHKRIRWFKTTAENNWLPTPDDLDRIGAASGGASQLVILNYPSNPAGTTYDDATLERLGDAARRNGIVLLSDEIYGEFHHEGGHTSVARFYPEGTIVSAGLSKWAGAGGWRLGTFAFSPELKDLQMAMTSVASETFSATSAPIQYAAVTAYEGGEEIERYLNAARRILKVLGQEVYSRLKNAGVQVVEPRGGFYVFPDFSPFRESLKARGMETDVDVCKRLIEDAGVMLLPGRSFGRGPKELTARLAYVDFDGDRVLNALRKNGLDSGIDTRFLRRYCGHTLEGVQKICTWLAE